MFSVCARKCIRVTDAVTRIEDLWNFVRDVTVKGEMLSY